MAAVVRTVCGDIEPSAAGVTLCHEHLWFDGVAAFGDQDLLLDSVALVADELLAARSLGLGTIVDVTPSVLGRNPAALAAIATRSKVNVVAGAGLFYGQFLPPFVAQMDVATLAEHIASEVEEGIAGGGVRAGAIGEVGNGVGGITALERKVLLATGRAQRISGAGVLTHTDMGRLGLEQLDLLEEGGADLSRVLVGHMDCNPDLPAHLAVARRGAFVGIDRIGVSVLQSDETRVRLVLSLLERGYARQVILSADIAHRSRLLANGGQGYGYTLNGFASRLRAAGVDDSTLRTILVENPRRLLSFSPH